MTNTRHNYPEAFHNLCATAIKLDVIDAIELVSITLAAGGELQNMTGEILNIAFASYKLSGDATTYRAITALCDEIFKGIIGVGGKISL